jgi:hypothetical protein
MNTDKLKLDSEQEQLSDVLSRFKSRVFEFEEQSWKNPISPNKWSSAQTTEHVALSFEQTLRMLNGEDIGFSIPAPGRFLAKFLFLKPALRTGSFRFKLKAPPAFEPKSVNLSSQALTERLQRSVESLSSEFSRRTSSGEQSFHHPLFGKILFQDSLKLLRIHAEHHLRQLK